MIYCKENPFTKVKVIDATLLALNLIITENNQKRNNKILELPKTNERKPALEKGGYCSFFSLFFLLHSLPLTV